MAEQKQLPAGTIVADERNLGQVRPLEVKTDLLQE